MADFTPPPTYAQVVLYDERTPDIKELIKSAKFNPIWLKWFLDLAALLPGGGPLGTVTSVAESFTGGIISVGGSPITSSGTLALTVAGTSGGIPYFSGATTWASSGVLAAGGLVVGGGAGTTPSTLSPGATTTILVGGGAGTAPVWTAATGSGSPVRASGPTLSTPVLGAASATSVSFSSTAGIIGTTTNDAAAAGSVGEYVSSAVGLTNSGLTTVWGDLTSISLTAGDWLVSTTGIWDYNGATWDAARVGISTTTGNSAAGLTLGSNYVLGGWASSATTPIDVAMGISDFRVSLSGTTTYYYKYMAQFAANGPPQLAGRISAHRIR